MRILVNSEGPDEMPHNASFQKHFYEEIITFESSVYTMDHTIFIASNQRKNPLEHDSLQNLIQRGFIFSRGVSKCLFL